MRQSVRKVLFIVSWAAFAVVAPVLVLYAMGYRLSDSQQNQAQQVGVLLVESVPRGAQVFFNGQYANTTPEAISNIKAGTAELEVILEGYSPWRKTITIDPAVVTEFRDIRLFPANIPKEALARDVSSFSLSPNRSLIALVVGQDNLVIINEEGVAVVGPITSPRAITNILWSPDSNKILTMHGGHSNYVFDISSPADGLRPLPSILNDSDTAWDARIPGRIIGLTADGQLIAYHTGTQSLAHITDDILEFATSHRNIYTVSSPGQRIDIRNLQGEVVGSINPTIEGSITKLLITPGGQIAAAVDGQRLIYIGSNGETHEIVSTHKSAGWSPDEQMLYVQTDANSLHVFNVSNERIGHINPEELKLIVRLSRPLRSPQWFAGGNHVIYQVDDEVLITEIDTRDHPLTTTIDTTNLGNAQVTVGQEGERIYYIKQSEHGTALLRSELVLQE